jgi:hypothetical protein
MGVGDRAVMVGQDLPDYAIAVLTFRGIKVIRIPTKST